MKFYRDEANTFFIVFSVCCGVATLRTNLLRNQQLLNLTRSYIQREAEFVKPTLKIKKRVLAQLQRMMGKLLFKFYNYYSHTSTLKAGFFMT